MISDPWEYFKTHDIKKLQKELHPDRHGGTKEANDKFAQLMSDYELSQTPQPEIDGVKVTRLIAQGDLRKVWRCKEGVVKELTLNNKSSQRLLKTEHENLKILEDDHHGKYFPKTRILKTSCLEEYPDLKCVSLARANYPTGFDGRTMGWITRRFLVGLGFAHMRGLCHNAVYPEHMLIREDHAGILTGWIHSTKRGEDIKIVSGKRKDWYRVKKASRQQDLNLLGRSLLEISGEIPRKMSGFFKSMTMKTPDAWSLEEEFTELLGELYGGPKFVPTNLTGLV